MLVIPMDSRPVCYDLPRQIAEISGQTALMPPKTLLGSVNKAAEFEHLYHWLEETLHSNKVETAVLALDTLAYGGLISSRWVDRDFNTVKQNMDKFFSLLKKYSINTLAVSSVMRISNNNDNTEEKAYWNPYGTRLFRYSELVGLINQSSLPEYVLELEKLTKDIPSEILEDYKATRKRNFKINKSYIPKISDKSLDFILYCLDDTGKAGLNLLEADELKAIINSNNLESKAIVQTGADEIISCLIARSQKNPDGIRVYPYYVNEKSKNITPKYEDKALKDSIKDHIALGGGIVATSIYDADLILVINAPSVSQGDHVFRISPEGVGVESYNSLMEEVNSFEKPFAIVDLLWANGADPLFTEKVVLPSLRNKNLYGFGAWNTAGNTVGSTLAMAYARFYAEKRNTFNKAAFKETLFTRLLDDWAYQSIVRQELNKPNCTQLADLMSPYTQILHKELDFMQEIDMSFPCERLFEIEIAVKKPATFYLST